MNRNDIIRMAREAGLGTSLCHNSVEGDRVWIEGADWHDELERFVALVEERAAAAEREAWQQEREQLMTQIGVLSSQILGMRMEFGEGPTVSNLSAALQAENAVNAAAIRARGQA